MQKKNWRSFLDDKLKVWNKSEFLDDKLKVWDNKPEFWDNYRLLR